jgi:hypothetical protein
MEPRIAFPSFKGIGIKESSHLLGIDYVVELLLIERTVRVQIAPSARQAWTLKSDSVIGSPDETDYIACLPDKDSNKTTA